MLRHTGERRSFAHNLRPAILLCLNAGFINAAGFMAFAVLTTAKNLRGGDVEKKLAELLK